MYHLTEALSLAGSALFTDITGLMVSGPLFDMKNVEVYKKQLEQDVSTCKETEVAVNKSCKYQRCTIKIQHNPNTSTRVVWKVQKKNKAEGREGGE